MRLLLVQNPSNESNETQVNCFLNKFGKNPGVGAKLYIFIIKIERENESHTLRNQSTLITNYNKRNSHPPLLCHYFSFVYLLKMVSESPSKNS